jgi:hypothetical protein
VSTVIENDQVDAEKNDETDERSDKIARPQSQAEEEDGTRDYRCWAPLSVRRVRNRCAPSLD